MNQAEQLFELSQDALRVAGVPAFPAPDVDGMTDELMFLDSENADGEALWGFLTDVEHEEEEEIAEHDEDQCSFTPLDTAHAELLIRIHLHNWLAERGWQVQLAARKAKRQWRLVDCLSPADGGGDRFDGDYPQGEDELTVLCASVMALGGAQLA